MSDALDKLLAKAGHLLPSKMMEELEDINKQEKKKKKKRPIYGSVHKGLQTGVAEGGVHAHALIRNQLRTLIDGRHRHIFVVRTVSGELVTLGTELDGAHWHSMESPSDLITQEAGSAHQHVIRIEREISLEDGTILKPGMILTTELDGEHTQGADMLETTNFDGAHPHILILNDEITLEALDIQEFWELFGPFDFEFASPIESSDQVVVRGGGHPIITVAKSFSGYEEPSDEERLLAASLGVELVEKEQIEQIFKQDEAQEVIFSKRKFKTLAEVMLKLRQLDYPDVEEKDIQDQPTAFRAQIDRPSDFDRDSLTTLRLEDGVRVKVGVRKELVEKQTTIQTLIFNKKTFQTAAEARKWAKDNDFSSSKVDETGSSFRLRQRNPDDFQRLRTITLREGVKATVGPLKESVKKEAFERILKSCPEEILIHKADQERRIVTGIVLEPGVVDAQGDVITEEEIEDTAAFFIQNSRVIGFRHRKKLPKAKLNGSMVMPAGFTVDGFNGKQKVIKGSWLISVHVPDDETWALIISKKLNAFSVGGFGSRTPIN